MRNEAALWRKVRPMLAGLHAVRIETGAMGPGTPDVNYVFGWIELKYLKAWPKRSETKVKLNHYTAAQKAWATKRSIAGGNVFFLLAVGSECLLFDGVTAARVVGHSTQSELKAHALGVWPKGSKRMKPELRSFLSNSSRDTLLAA